MSWLTEKVCEEGQMWGRGLESGANEFFSSFLNRINKFSFCFPVVVLCTCHSICPTASLTYEIVNSLKMVTVSILFSKCSLNE